jgi:DNA processing protein
MQESTNIAQDDIALWVALNQINGLGCVGIYQLLTQFGTPDAIFSASINQLREVIGADIAEKIHQGVADDVTKPTLDWLKKDHAHIITLADAHYPQLLLTISNPPALLYALGDLQWLNQPAIAMVGSRHSTPQGEKNAEEFAKSLCESGLCVTSGMALGIDGAAHRGALRANGATIAVVGTGLDIVYPSRHRDLAHQIAARGLILSEFNLGTPSKAQNFPRRNRIISGLSLGCLVVEANVDSGSLITARLATEQGREVFAIPGSIHSPVAKGCHLLIKQGAKLVECVEDIVEEIKHMLPDYSPFGLMTQTGHTSPESNTVLDCMGYDAIDFDAILSATGLTPEVLSSMLTVLELEGKIRAQLVENTSA